MRRATTRTGRVALGVLLAVAFVMRACAPAVVQAQLTADLAGQRLAVTGGVQLDRWFQGDRHFQNMQQWDVALRLDSRYVPGVEIDAAYAFRQWLSNRSKLLAHNVLNAERTRANETTYHVQLFYDVPLGREGGVAIGLQGGRRVVHWIERRAQSQGEYFNDFPTPQMQQGPHEHGPANVQAKCVGVDDVPCPGVGYHDGVRPVIRIRYVQTMVRIVGPAYRWKDLTLPWYAWRIVGAYQGSDWRGRVTLEAGGLRDTALLVEASRRLYGMLHVRAAAGTTPHPGWDPQPLTIYGLGFQLRR